MQILYGESKSKCMMTWNILTHLPLVRHISIGELSSIGSGNCLSPGQHQVITWTNDELLSIRLLGINFSEIEFKIQNFPFIKMHLKMSVNWRPFCPGDIDTRLCIYSSLNWVIFGSGTWDCFFNLPIFPLMIMKIFVVNFIIIIKREIWRISHCLGLAHEMLIFFASENGLSFSVPSHYLKQSWLIV